MPPLIIAHRGDSAHCPENTLASFAAALELGAELVECDVQLTRDGQVVVIHDGTVDRTTDGAGAVRSLTLAEVRALSAGYPARFGDRFAGERVSTLAEVLAFVRERARLLIEIKPDSVGEDEEEGIEARAVAEVLRAGMREDVAFLSFSRKALLRCRRLAPEIRRGHLFFRAETDEVLAGAREVGCDIVLPEKGMLSGELCRRATEAGVEVATWVVDDVEELRALRRFDLFGVATNCPGLLLEAREESSGGGR